MTQDFVERLSVGSQFSFKSEIMANKRYYRVSLPSSYKKSKSNYPVIYVLDAKYYFNDVISQVRFLSRYGIIPELIIIGIETQRRRLEYTPPGIRLPDVQSGLANKFTKFLKEELMSHIEQKYRTKKLKILIGHSHAALYGSYVFYSVTNLFRWYLLLDPPNHLENNKIETRTIEFLNENTKPLRLVVYENVFGWSDKNWKKALEIKNESVSLFRAKITNENHETMVMTSIYNGLKELFKDYKYTHFKELSLLELKKRYKRLSLHYGYQVEVPYSILSMNAEDQITLAKPKLAKELIEELIRKFGKNENVNRLQKELVNLINSPPEETRDQILGSKSPNQIQIKKLIGNWTGIVEGAQLPYSIFVNFMLKIKN